MGIFDGCLLACDIDGTLMESGYINPKNIEKIEYFMSEGGKFSISTGRSVGAFSDVLEQLKRVSPSVVGNGCMIYDYENRKLLFEIVLPESDHRIAKIVADSDINVGIEVHCGAEVFTLKRSKEVTLHQTYEKFEAPDITFEEVDGRSWNKVLYAVENAEDRAKIKELIKNEKVSCNFLETCAIIDGTFYNYYEQIPVGVSKASALKELRKIFGTKEGCLFAIGDYYNDIEMLKSADIAAAPLKSPDEVKQIAEYITCSCDDGAVADFIDYLTNKFNA